MEKQRTGSYQFTFHPQDWNDIKALKELKEAISKNNKMNGRKFYVKLQGRLGKDNPNARKYRIKARHGAWNAYQCIRKEDAAYFDVYVYERY